MCKAISNLEAIKLVLLSISKQQTLTWKLSNVVYLYIGYVNTGYENDFLETTDCLVK